jgi:hypothetical protein
MRTYLSAIGVITVLLASSIEACHSTPTSDFTGSWKFQVEDDDGSWQHPMFVFKQRGDKLTGTYDGHLGQQEVTGTVTGSTAAFGFLTPRPVKFFDNYFYLETITATYMGTLETETTMSGTVEFSNGVKGKWTATRQ